MAIRTDRLQVSLEAIGASKVKADLADLAKAERDAGAAGRTMAEGTDKVTQSAERMTRVRAYEWVAQKKKESEEAARAAEEHAEAIRKEEAAARNLEQVFSRLGIAAIVTKMITESVRAIAAFEDIRTRLDGVTKSEQEMADAMTLVNAAVDRGGGSVAEMTNAYIALRQRGLVPTLEAMTAIANMAAQSGKTLQEQAGSYADATGGDFGGLRDLGIVAEEVGGRIQVTFQGVTESLGNNTREIEEYLQRIGNGDYAEAGAEHARNLSGSWDALKGSLAELASALGEDGGIAGALTWIINRAEDATDALVTMSRTGRIDMDQNNLITWLMSATPSGLPMIMREQYLTNSGLGASEVEAESVRVANERAQAQAELNAELALGSKNMAALAELDRKSNEEGKKTLDRLQQQLIAQREGRSVQIAATAAAAAAATTDKELAAQIMDVGLRLSEEVRKQEEARQARKDGAAASREQSQALADLRSEITASNRDLQELHGVYGRLKKAIGDGTVSMREGSRALEELDALMKRVREKEDSDLMRDMYKTIQDDNRQLKERADAFRELRERLNPAAEAQRRLSEETRILDQALERGATNLREYNALLAKMRAERDGVLSKGVMSITGMTMEDATRFVDDVGRGLSGAITDALINGFSDAGPNLRNFLRSVFADAMNQNIQNNFVKPLQDWAQGGFQGGLGGFGEIMGSGFAGGGWLALIQAGIQYNQMQYDKGWRAEDWSFDDVSSMWAYMQASGLPGMFADTAALSILTDQWLQGLGLDGRTASWLTGSAITGSLMGSLFGIDNKPRIDVGGRDMRGAEATGIGVFGPVSVSTERMKEPTSDELLQAILRLDETLSQLLSPSERYAVRDSLGNFSLDNARKPEDVLAARFAAILEAVNPQWQTFLSGIEDLQERIAAFAALRNLEEQVGSLDEAIVQLGGSSMERLRAQLQGFDEDVKQARADLAAAYESDDPTRIAEANAAAIKAVVDRYNAEIELVNNLRDAIDQAAQQAYQLNLTLAQRVAGITGDYSGPIDVTAGRMADLQAQVMATENAQRALDLLTNFVSVVDAWVAANQQRINAELQAGLADIAARRAALQAEAQASAVAAQAAAQAAQEARRAEIEALNEQLRLAQEWLRVLDQANALQQEMQYGLANPLSGYGRLDALDAAIRALTGGRSVQSALEGGLSADSAAELLALLQRRLQLIQGEGLMDRPSDAYTDVYNETLRLIELVRGQAGPGAESAEDLQRQIAALQAQGNDISAAGFAGNEAALAALAAEEAALRAEAQRQLDALNEQALAQYQWAQGEAQRLQDARTAELREQLEILTGGLDIDEFIALRTQQTTELLTDIRDNIRDFLDAIEGGGNGFGAGGGTGGGGGNSAPPPPTDGSHVLSPIGANGPQGGVHVEYHVTINGTDMTREQLRATVQDEIVSSVGVIKRELARA